MGGESTATAVVLIYLGNRAKKYILLLLKEILWCLLLLVSEDNEVTAADVYNYMEGLDVPECSRLFYSDDLKGQSYKV